MYEECEHGSLRSTCQACRSPVPTPPAGVVVARFRAMYDGSVCDGCGFVICKGQEIAKLSTDPPTYTHAGSCEP